MDLVNILNGQFETLQDDSITDIDFNIAGYWRVGELRLLFFINQGKISIEKYGNANVPLLNL